MPLNELLNHLCRELDLPIPQPDRDQSYSLPLNPDFCIKCTAINPGCSLSANLAGRPQDNREDLYTRLMHANFLGQGTGGARLGMDADENFLTLSLGIPYEMDYPLFKESVEDFANYAAFWREEIRKFEAQ